VDADGNLVIDRDLIAAVRHSEYEGLTVYWPAGNGDCGRLNSISVVEDGEFVQSNFEDLIDWSQTREITPSGLHKCIHQRLLDLFQRRW
jgi:hypothetical protein